MTKITANAGPIEVRLTVTGKQIADIMCSAIEGNGMTRAWCAGVYLRGTWEKTPLKGIWYFDHPEIYESGGFTIEVVEITDESKGDSKKHRLHRDDFTAGITLMAQRHPQHFADWMTEEFDAITADVFLQCVTLKEVIYG